MVLGFFLGAGFALAAFEIKLQLEAFISVIVEHLSLKFELL